MSFAAKLFTTFVHNGLRNLTANGAITLPTRRFHLMVKSIPTCNPDAFSLNKSPIISNVVSSLSLITGLQRLLVPVSCLINQVSGFKVKGRLKRRCKDCYIVVRQQRGYVICPTHPRHKQMAMKKRDYKSWILTHATQSKVRPY